MKTTLRHFYEGSLELETWDNLYLENKVATSYVCYGSIFKAARVIADFITRNPQIVYGKKVIELGCGVALPSFIAERCGASLVVASDLEEGCLELLKRNIIRNKSNIHSLLLDWKTPPEGDFEVMICSDLLYSESFAGIKNSVDSLVRRGGVVIFAVTHFKDRYEILLPEIEGEVLAKESVEGLDIIIFSKGSRC